MNETQGDDLVRISQAMAQYTSDAVAYQAVSAYEIRVLLGVLILFGLVVIFLLSAVNNKHEG